jgi:phosphohistidine phosphatase
MKSVILIRHVKSDWSNLLTDFDRPIREDKKEDARQIAKEIAKKGLLPELIVSSPGVRTLQTAKIFCSKWKYPFGKVLQEKSLYECMATDILSVINRVDDKYDTIAIVCHNPAITDFVNQYSDSSVDNVPTTGVVKITFERKHWKDITGEGKVNWFLYPKGLK